jgi:hypothetical protein
MRRRLVVPLLLGAAMALPPLEAGQAQWVLLARRALGRVEQLRHQSPGDQPSGAQSAVEVATVMLDAPAARVYAKALKVARRNNALQLREDATRRHLEVSEGPHHVTLSVASLSDKVSQLMIVANVLPGQESDAGRAVDAVLRVCRELKKTCTVPR